MRAWGYVTFAEPNYRGSDTTVTASMGDTSLHVEDVSDFVGVAGMFDLDRACSPIAYTAATIDDDGLGGTLILAAPLAADVPEGTLVQVWACGDAVVEYEAAVTLSTGGEAYAVYRDSRVLHMPTGPRDDGDQELVSLRWLEDEATWLIESIDQQTPKPDLSTARAATLPGTAIAAGPIGAAVTLPNLTTVPPVVTTAIGAAFGGLSGGGGIGGVDGGLWSDTDGGFGVDGGIW